MDQVGEVTIKTWRTGDRVVIHPFHKHLLPNHNVLTSAKIKKSRIS